MKAKVVEKNEFVPFDVTITLESKEEAMLLWHLANHNNLKLLLESDERYIEEFSPNLPIATRFDSSVWNVTNQVLKERGVLQ